MAIPNWQSAAPPQAGTSRWFAWLFAPDSARPLLEFAFALERELRSIAEARIDHGVAHLKLHWWREEIQRLAQGEPRHPLTRVAFAAAPDAGPAWLSMLDFLTCLDMDLACTTYDTEAELEVYCGLADGMQRAISGVVIPGDVEVDRFARAAGRAVRLVEIVRDLRQDAIDGRIYVPLAWLDAERIDPRELRSENTTPGIRRCLTRLATRARDHHGLAMAATNARGTAELRAQHVLLGLHLALLDRMERGQFDVSRGRDEIGSMRSLWTAWRIARQH